MNARLAQSTANSNVGQEARPRRSGVGAIEDRASSARRGAPGSLAGDLWFAQHRNGERAAFGSDLTRWLDRPAAATPAPTHDPLGGGSRDDGAHAPLQVEEGAVDRGVKFGAEEVTRSPRPSSTDEAPRDVDTHPVSSGFVGASAAWRPAPEPSVYERPNYPGLDPLDQLRAAHAFREYSEALEARQDTRRAARARAAEVLPADAGEDDIALAAILFITEVNTEADERLEVAAENLRAFLDVIIEAQARRVNSLERNAEIFRRPLEAHKHILNSAANGHNLTQELIDEHQPEIDQLTVQLEGGMTALRTAEASLEYFEGVRDDVRTDWERLPGDVVIGVAGGARDASQAFVNAVDWIGDSAARQWGDAYVYDESRAEHARRVLGPEVYNQLVRDGVLPERPHWTGIHWFAPSEIRRLTALGVLEGNSVFGDAYSRGDQLPEIHAETRLGRAVQSVTDLVLQAYAGSKLLGVAGSFAVPTGIEIAERARTGDGGLLEELAGDPLQFIEAMIELRSRPFFRALEEVGRSRAIERGDERAVEVAPTVETQPNASPSGPIARAVRGANSSWGADALQRWIERVVGPDGLATANGAPPRAHVAVERPSTAVHMQGDGGGRRNPGIGHNSGQHSVYEDLSRGPGAGHNGGPPLDDAGYVPDDAGDFLDDANDFDRSNADGTFGAENDRDWYDDTDTGEPLGLDRWADEELGGRRRLDEELEGYLQDPESIPRGKDFIRFDAEISAEELDELMRDPAVRDIIMQRLRGGGGYHEWIIVSEYQRVRRLGVTAEDILSSDYRISTRAVLVDPDTGQRFRHIDAHPGKRVREDIPDGLVDAQTARRLSRKMHREIRDLIDTALREKWTRERFLNEISAIQRRWTFSGE